MPAIVFDIGGTHLRCGVATTDPRDPDFSLLHKTYHAIPNFLTHRSDTQIWDELVTLLTDYISSVAATVGPYAPVIIGFPGPIDANSRIVAAPTIMGRGTSVPDLRAAVTSATGRATFLLNDMSAAAWGLCTRTDAHRFIIVTVGSGIGSKVFDRMSGVIDRPPYAGEIGHVMVDPRPAAPLCDCGGRGHLGAIASGRGIERAARRKAQRNPDSFRSSLCCSRFGASADNLNNEEHLAPAARAGDEWTLAVILKCTKPLGRILSHLTIAFGLDRIAVMGGFAQSVGLAYLDLLRQAMHEPQAFPGFPDVDNGLLELCSTNEEVGLVGAAMYAYQCCGS